MSSPPCAHRKLRVLVVEDHVDIMKVLTLLVKTLGHEVVPATSVAQALTQYALFPCEVLISDIELPDGTGWDLLETMSTPGAPPLYAIAMSGRGLEADLALSATVGFRAHLLKPFGVAVLKAQLDHAMAEISALEYQPT